jgi:hypothetical protein
MYLDTTHNDNTHFTSLFGEVMLDLDQEQTDKLPIDCKWSELVPSNDNELDEFLNWVLDAFPKDFQASDCARNALAAKWNPELPKKWNGMVYYRNRHERREGVALRYINPVKGYGARETIKLIEDDFDFEWTQEWQSKTRQ